MLKGVILIILCSSKRKDMTG